LLIADLLAKLTTVVHYTSGMQVGYKRLQQEAQLSPRNRVSAAYYTGG